jgi:Zn-dependent peptidase ImmA (M78 family)
MNEKPDFERSELEAKKVRDEQCLSTPAINIIEVAETLGLKVLEIDFRDRNDISGILDYQKKVIYLNKSDKAFHKRFTIAHEIGHFRLHGNEFEKNPNIGIYYRRPIGGELDPKEKEANCFAANLLVPLSHLKKLMTIYSDYELAEIFAVSSQVIGYRKKYLDKAIND